MRKIASTTRWLFASKARNIESAGNLAIVFAVVYYLFRFKVLWLYGFLIILELAFLVIKRRFLDKPQLK